MQICIYEELYLDPEGDSGKYKFHKIAWGRNTERKQTRKLKKSIVC